MEKNTLTKKHFPRKRKKSKEAKKLPSFTKRVNYITGQLETQLN